MIKPIIGTERDRPSLLLAFLSIPYCSGEKTELTTASCFPVEDNVKTACHKERSMETSPRYFESLFSYLHIYGKEVL